MPVADALAPDRNVFDRVEQALVERSVALGHRPRVLRRQFAHEIRVEGADFLQAQPDVASFREVQQLLRRPVRTGPSFDQRRMNLITLN